MSHRGFGYLSLFSNPLNLAKGARENTVILPTGQYTKTSINRNGILFGSEQRIFEVGI